MSQLQSLVELLIVDFEKVSALSNMPTLVSEIEIDFRPVPHTHPSSLPKGRMAVYMFFFDDVCLKVGKVGPNSQARYTSQHYNPRSSNSNLSKSILKSKRELAAKVNQQFKTSIFSITEDTVGTWIEQNTSRVNILINREKGKQMLSLLEIFLQCRLKPFFEG